ncbi:sensor histidine kinase [Chondrinema litorale]|uniref:sensor histidine kinase n=1 Tax=Chondrinema litorale TaxID=2994555 RepID=UPI002543608C|nr:histidine kinase [Chondrinema litorale]UZR97608.1 histidine kinase [Chondrinema litorale]
MKKTFFKSKEFYFQVVLHVLVFIFYSFDKKNPGIKLYQVVYFVNYATSTMFISYYLLPKFFYNKKHFRFFTDVLLTVVFVIIVEELVLEQIFFPDTKGRSFPGVFYSLLDVLPIITILSGFKFAWDALLKQNEVDHLKEAVAESKLQLLKSQINPHFLFNNLNNLYSYAIENSPKTPTIILELSSVLRYMLYECRERYVPLAKELEQMENFTKLYQLQIEERGEVNFNIHHIKTNYQIAPLILIVFIENAFKHSQASQSENIYIDIRIDLTDDGILIFKCKNNFHEVSNTENLSHGIGLENVKKRLDLLYADKHELSINESDNLYGVELKLYLTKINENEMHYHRRSTTSTAYS